MLSSGWDGAYIDFSTYVKSEASGYSDTTTFCSSECGSNQWVCTKSLRRSERVTSGPILHRNFEKEASSTIVS
jgi:hypothetical protein